MPLGLRRSRFGRRRTIRWKVVSAILVLGLLLAAGLFAYETGSIAAQHPVTRLEKRVAALNQNLEALQQQNAELTANAQAAQQREAEWQARYQQEVPNGQSKELFELVRDRLASGVEARRLAFVIEATGNLDSCDPKSKTKRFFVQTPIYQGANDAVSFARDTITVTAEGPNAVNAMGNAEGWFDPAKPIKVRFTQLGGRVSEASGPLPLHHAIVAGGSEYRFTVLPGPRGFVKITGKRCNFP